MKKFRASCVLLAAVATALVSTTSATTAGASANYPTVIKGAHPFAYWQLNEAPGASVAADSSGNGNGGSYAGCVALGKTGPIRHYAATAARLGIQPGCYMSDRILSPYSGSFTVEAWVRPLSTAKYYETFLDSRYTDEPCIGCNPSGDYGFDMKLTGTKNPGGQQVCIDIGDGQEWMSNACMPFAFATLHWYYLGMSVNATTNTVSVYVNQNHTTEPLTNSGRSPLLCDFWHPLTVGGNPRQDADVHPENFNGTVGQVAVYERALKPAALLAHYYAGVGA